MNKTKTWGKSLWLPNANEAKFWANMVLALILDHLSSVAVDILGDSLTGGSTVVMLLLLSWLTAWMSSHSQGNSLDTVDWVQLVYNECAESVQCCFLLSSLIYWMTFLTNISSRNVARKKNMNKAMSVKNSVMTGAIGPWKTYDWGNRSMV